MESLPLLRADLELLPRSDAPGCVVSDPALGRRLRLDARGAELAAALREPCEAAALCERLEMAPESLERILAVFGKQRLLDTPETREHLATSQALAAVVATDRDEVPLLYLPEAAFSCTMCGGCCGGHNVGPVSKPVLEALEPHLESLAAEIGTEQSLFATLPVSEVHERAICRSSGGSCVFLKEDNTCRIHANLGAEYKPEPCRLFPYEFKATPGGIAVSISTECRGFAEATRGKAFSAQEDSIRALLKRVPASILGKVPLRVQMEEGVDLAYGQWQPIEARLLELVDEKAGTPMAMFQAMSAELNARVGYESEPAPAEAVASAWGDFLKGMGEALTSIRGARVREDERVLVHGESLDLLRSAVAELSYQPGRIASDAPLARHGALLRSLFRQRLSGQALLEGPHVRSALASMVWEWLAARAITSYRLRQVKRRAPQAQDLIDGVAVMRFLMRSHEVSKLSAQVSEAMSWLFLDQLDSLLTTLRTQPPGAGRLELYAF